MITVSHPLRRIRAPTVVFRPVIISVSFIFAFQLLGMVEIFLKKKYLVDNLFGLVDIHNHILPGIDDGAKTVEDSRELLAGFSQIGVTHFICTPHIMHHHYDNTPGIIKGAHDLLLQSLASTALSDIKLDFAAEHMIDDNFEAILEKGEVLGLNRQHLLIEMSYLQPSFNFDVAVEKVFNSNYFPVLAHPERYMYFHQKYGKYAKMKAQGIKFQLNLMSLSADFYGSMVQKVAQKLLQDNLVDFVRSDIHNVHQLERMKEIKLNNGVLNRLMPIIEHTIETFY